MTDTKTILVTIKKNGIVTSDATGHVIGKLLVDYDLIDRTIVPIQRNEQDDSAQLVDNLDKLVNHNDEQVDANILIAKVQKHIMDLDLEIKELKRCMEIPRIEDIEEIQRLNTLLEHIAEVSSSRIINSIAHG